MTRDGHLEGWGLQSTWQHLHVKAPHWDALGAALCLWAPGSGPVPPVSLTPGIILGWLFFFSWIQWPEMAGFNDRCFQPKLQCQKKLIKDGNDGKGSEQPIPSMLPVLAPDNESLAWINTRLGWAEGSSWPGRGCERAGMIPGPSPIPICQSGQSHQQCALYIKKYIHIFQEEHSLPKGFYSVCGTLKGLLKKLSFSLPLYVTRKAKGEGSSF